MVNAETQTEKQSSINTDDANFFNKLKSFILELISLNVAKESSASQSLLADSALRNAFGIDLRIEKNKNETNKDERNMITHMEKSTKKRNRKEATQDISTTDEDGVLSDNSQDNENIWETIEKRQVKVTKNSNQKTNNIKQSNKKNNKKRCQ